MNLVDTNPEDDRVRTLTQWYERVYPNWNPARMRIHNRYDCPNCLTLNDGHYDANNCDTWWQALMTFNRWQDVEGIFETHDRIGCQCREHCEAY